MEDVGLSCEAVPPDVDEDAIQASTPVALALARAEAKAAEVAARRLDALVIGADQVAFVGDEVFGKPSDPEDHLRRLRQLRSHPHSLVTGVVLIGPGVRRSFHELTRLTFREDLSDAELAAYVASGEGSGCAGGYRVEAPGAWLIARIEGAWYNIVGLPIRSLLRELRTLGWRLGTSDGR